MSENKPLYLRAFEARCEKVKQYDKPVVSWVDGCWALTAVDPMVPEMYSAYLNRLNGIEDSTSLTKCLNDIRLLGQGLAGMGMAEEARKAVAQYRVPRLTDLPPEWRPALLYDLKQLLKEYQP